MITGQTVAHVAEPVELDERLAQLRVPARQLVLAVLEVAVGVAELSPGLAVGRLVGIAQWGGSYALAFGADALPGSYNPGALWLLELPSALLLLIALIATRDRAPAG